MQRTLNSSGSWSTSTQHNGQDVFGNFAITGDPDTQGDLGQPIACEQLFVMGNLVGCQPRQKFADFFEPFDGDGELTVMCIDDDEDDDDEPILAGGLVCPTKPILPSGPPVTPLNAEARTERAGNEFEGAEWGTPTIWDVPLRGKIGKRVSNIEGAMSVLQYVAINGRLSPNKKHAGISGEVGGAVFGSFQQWDLTDLVFGRFNSVEAVDRGVLTRGDVIGTFHTHPLAGLPSYDDHLVFFREANEKLDLGHSNFFHYVATSYYHFVLQNPFAENPELETCRGGNVGKAGYDGIENFVEKIISLEGKSEKTSVGHLHKGSHRQAAHFNYHKKCGTCVYAKSPTGDWEKVGGR